MDSSRVELICKKIVKPSLSTPPSQRNYKLCLMDQLMTPKYIPIAFFYPNHHHNHPADITSEHDRISSILEESLSKTLASYYPFAGTLTDNISINSNDMGATFLRVRIRCSMSAILEEETTNAQDIIFPNGLAWSSSPRDQPSLVIAQLSQFDCGGIALSVCITHKIADAYTLCHFINDWAAMARQSSDHQNLAPRLTAAAILPPDDGILDIPGDLKLGQHCITKRFVFDPENLGLLKAKATAESRVQNPTRVEVVSALVYKCAMFASMASSKSFKPSILCVVVNLRPLIRLPTTPNYVGNLVSNFPVPSTNENEVSFSRLVSEIRKQKAWLYEKFKEMKTDDLVKVTLETVAQTTNLHGKNDFDGYTCSSFCTLPTYQIDFGWGRPTRVSSAASGIKNLFVLMDNQNMDGIEAFVTLEKQVMHVFQTDLELLAFASTSSC